MLPLESIETTKGVGVALPTDVDVDVMSQRLHVQMDERQAAPPAILCDWSD